MKKLIALVLLTVSASAMAQHHHGHHHGQWHRGHGGGWNWVPAIIIGGVVGSAIANSNRPVDPPPVIIQQPQVIVQQENCSPWREVQTYDGRIYRERTCTQ
jgi:hypothetical protein